MKFSYDCYVTFNIMLHRYITGDSTEGVATCPFPFYRYKYNNIYFIVILQFPNIFQPYMLYSYVVIHIIYLNICYIYS
jgi:hypothetical protein